MKAIYIKPVMEIVQLDIEELLEDEWGQLGLSNQTEDHPQGNTGFFDNEGSNGNANFFDD